MALLERVSTLVRANLNDLIDKAEDPEKMIKQVILDMQNQLLQVKTQVAIAIADQHVMEKKHQENEEKTAEWVRKAEMAVDKKQDDLARVALERSLSYRQMGESFRQQVADQKQQVENLKSALQKLAQKLAEAQAKKDVLIAQHRRARRQQGHRRAVCHQRPFHGRHVRPDEGQGPSQRSRQPGEGGVVQGRRGGATGGARKTGPDREDAGGHEGEAGLTFSGSLHRRSAIYDAHGNTVAVRDRRAGLPGSFLERQSAAHPNRLRETHFDRSGDGVRDQPGGR